ncbi:MAG: exo-alpha-sialidase [Armatimonadota bacterium]|nr:MAG: exo-alpha-sialidase [Armatimonadota bacterium]
MPDGRWVCGFRAARTKGGTVEQHALITWSDDEGRSWSTPIRPFEPPAVEGKRGLFRAAHPTALGAGRVLATLCWVDHSDASLPFFNEETEGLLDTRIFHSYSADGGATWSPPVLMDTSPFNVPTPATGPTLVLPNGTRACQFELNKHYHDTAQWRHSSVLMFSCDEGHSWPEHVIVSNDPENRIFYWDQRPSVLKDGTILDLFWTYDNQLATYLNIHARRSADNGRTWAQIWDTGVPGQPAPPVSLRDGRIAMVYVDRTGAPVIKLRVSDDGGMTWPEPSEAVLYQAATPTQTERKATMQDAWAEMAKFSAGLPVTASLADEDVLVVYYAGPETDHTDIEWVRVRP